MDENYLLYLKTKDAIYEIKKQNSLTKCKEEKKQLELEFSKLTKELNNLRAVLNII